MRRASARDFTAFTIEVSACGMPFIGIKSSGERFGPCFWKISPLEFKFHIVLPKKETEKTMNVDCRYNAPEPASNSTFAILEASKF